MSEENRPDKTVELNEVFARLEGSGSDENADGSEEPVSPRPSRSEPDPPARGGLPIAGSALLVALIATGIAGLGLYRQWVAAATPDSEIVELGNRLKQLETKFDNGFSEVPALRERLDEVSGRLAGLDPLEQAQLDDLEARLDGTIEGLRAEFGTTRDDWLLAEVEYLLRLGSQRVLMNQDVDGALALYRAADEIVRDARGVSAFELRKTIASDIAEMEATPRVDVDGIYLRLSALMELIPRLRQPVPEFLPGEVAALPVSESATLWERTKLLFARAGKQLASLIQFRGSDEIIRPLLPPEEEYYLHQNLLLKLQVAQLALMDGDQAIFDNSLAEAQAWTEHYFDPEHPATLAVRSGIEGVASAPVTAEMPEIRDSVEAVRRLMSGYEASGEGVK